MPCAPTNIALGDWARSNFPYNPIKKARAISTWAFLPKAKLERLLHHIGIDSFQGLKGRLQVILAELR